MTVHLNSIFNNYTFSDTFRSLGWEPTWIPEKIKLQNEQESKRIQIVSIFVKEIWIFILSLRGREEKWGRGHYSSEVRLKVEIIDWKGWEGGVGGRGGATNESNGPRWLSPKWSSLLKSICCDKSSCLTCVCVWVRVCVTSTACDNRKQQWRSRS